jgi:outer membrane receptor for monomeric catechols
LSAVGKLTDEWSIIANYSYVDSRITNDADPTRIGKRFRNVPYNTANLWTRYNLIQTDCQTFGVAAGSRLSALS